MGRRERETCGRIERERERESSSNSSKWQFGHTLVVKVQFSQILTTNLPNIKSKTSIKITQQYNLWAHQGPLLELHKQVGTFSPSDCMELLFVPSRFTRTQGHYNQHTSITQEKHYLFAKIYLNLHSISQHKRC